MPSENKLYYYSDNERIPLIPVNDMVGVKTSKDSLDRLNFFNGEGEEIKPTMVIPQYGILIYKAESSNENRIVPSSTRREIISNRVSIFKQSENDSSFMIATDEFVVKFKSDVSKEQIDELNKKNDVEVLEILDKSENKYVLQVKQDQDLMKVIHVANAYYESGAVVYSHPNFVRTFQRMSTTNDPRVGTPVFTEDLTSESFLSQQWHLQTAKVTDAWQITKGDRNIKIAIIDDGIDVDHPEFKGKVIYQYDFENDTADGRPKNLNNNRCHSRFLGDPIDDCHGTACAGVATAAGVKAYGAAPECSLMAIRMSFSLSDVDQEKLFKEVINNNPDVISCSWGPSQRFGDKYILPPGVTAQLERCTTEGRNGKGIPVFFAAGNYNENTSLNGYTTHPNVMVIAASNSEEERSSYSNFGKEILVCAPSNGGEKSIFTTDIHGEDGYNRGNLSNGDDIGNYTNSFGGTSSSTPLVAGIAGLILSVNPNLSWQQVRDILVRTADKIGDLNTYREKHSEYYGYGRVNAFKAVEEARRIH